MPGQGDLENRSFLSPGIAEIKGEERENSDVQMLFTITACDSVGREGRQMGLFGTLLTITGCDCGNSVPIGTHRYPAYPSVPIGTHRYPSVPCIPIGTHRYAGYRWVPMGTVGYGEA